MSHPYLHKNIAPNCTSYYHSMREPNSRVDFTKNDFILSEQVSAQAQATKVFGIDWARIFTTRTGSVEGTSSLISVAKIPVVGNLLSDATANYALYNLMEDNKGYDVVFYPKYETKVYRPIIGIGFFAKITKVKATARLAKFKN